MTELGRRVLAQRKAAQSSTQGTAMFGSGTHEDAERRDALSRTELGRRALQRQADERGETGLVASTGNSQSDSELRAQLGTTALGQRVLRQDLEIRRERGERIPGSTLTDAERRKDLASSTLGRVLLEREDAARFARGERPLGTDPSVATFNGKPRETVRVEVPFVIDRGIVTFKSDPDDDDLVSGYVAHIRAKGTAKEKARLDELLADEKGKALLAEIAAAVLKNKREAMTPPAAVLAPETHEHLRQRESAMLLDAMTKFVRAFGHLDSSIDVSIGSTGASFTCYVSPEGEPTIGFSGAELHGLSALGINVPA